MPSSARSTARNPYLRADTLVELLSWHDLDFVRCVYVTILGRQPDPEGEATYVARLRAGFSKKTIVGQLRRSPEGRLHDPGIAGLDRELRRHRNATRPFVGWFVRAITSREGDTRSERQSRLLQAGVREFQERYVQLSHETAAKIDETQAKVVWMADHFGLSFDELSKRLQDLVAPSGLIQGGVERIRSSQNQLGEQMQEVLAIAGRVEARVQELHDRPGATTAALLKNVDPASLAPDARRALSRMRHFERIAPQSEGA